VEWENAPKAPARAYTAGPRSVVVLFAREREGGSARGESGSNLTTA
jgi:hypothetical protein